MTSAAGDNRTGHLPFLFEIGTDDLPARFIPVAIDHLREAFPALIDELGLGRTEPRILATPRRTALLVDSLAVRQEDREIEVKGPPLSIAYGDDGEPTPAALGFARKNGVDLADCGTVADAKGGEFLSARKIVVGRGAAELLAERLPGLLSGIPFPKRMRWGTCDVEYARPVQWLVALLGEDVVPVEFAGRTAGRETRGHRTLADDARFEIPRPADYVELLAEHGVVVDRDRRRRLIEEGAAAALADLDGAEWLRDEELLTEVVDLCEHPSPFVGGYDEAFFALPAEVIVTALKAHQRYFAVGREGAGDLLPRFLAVRDGDLDHLDNVRLGNEKVLRARLSDALFYWDFDQRRTPDEHVARLDDVTWLEGYGSVGGKGRRIVELADWLWRNGRGEAGEVPPALARAASLCKFDLVTEMIRDGKEFTKLEGVIGARYAAAAGEPADVCAAIEGYYRPRSSGDDLPDGRIASVLALADRYDNLAGCWLAGFAPTGAKDPYALRRQALALLRIEMELGGGGIGAALDRALSGYSGFVDESRVEAAAGELRDFVQRRLAGHLEALDAAGDVIRAVLPVHGDDPADALAWVRALAEFRDHPDFLLLATGFKRCKNILEGALLGDDQKTACLDRWTAGGGTPAGESFADLPEPAECALRDAVAAGTPALVAGEDSGDYAAIFRTLSGFGPAIDAFFDAVRVNVADEDLRRRRHDFLREIHGLFARYAELSALAPAENE